jgi:hypothetical protein
MPTSTLPLKHLPAHLTASLRVQLAILLILNLVVVAVELASLVEFALVLMN